jgi:hypothetical protein
MLKAPSIASPISPHYGDDDSVSPETPSVMDVEFPPETAPEEAEKPASKYGDEPGFILTPPVEYQGRTVDFISIDIGKLKGADLKAIGREFKARFKPDPNESYFLDNQYLILLFARINGLDEGFFDRLNGVVYLQLTEFYKIRMKSILGN